MPDILVLARGRTKLHPPLTIGQVSRAITKAGEHPGSPVLLSARARNPDRDDSRPVSTPEAVNVFIERKFGRHGAYNPETPAPWQDAKAIKQGVSPYSEEFADCLADVAQYAFDTYGRFPNTFSTMVLSGFVQAVHLDTGLYDTHHEPGTYLRTHAHHTERRHKARAGS